MKSLVLFSLSALLFSISTSFKPDDAWENLLDKNLSKWSMYQSYRHKNGYSGKMPTDEQGQPIKPIGYGKNEANVFTVKIEDGQPILHISGEIYGCIFTKQDFENYHLTAQVKWGTKKWEPRLNEPMDSGILYHSQGEAGVDYFRSWLLGQEFQIMENGTGDWWPIASAGVSVHAEKRKDSTNYIFNPKAPLVKMGAGAPDYYCQRNSNSEKPYGEWNQLELICFGDKSLHIVNGKVVMALSNLVYNETGQLKPLSKGKIQLQSEAGEVYFKDVKIRPITGIPEKYSQYFK
ncbi:DUF1080 domain-containing protein [Pedobacter sp. HMF7647]|uniref:DUF1080 domain-containing protein n=1 Tax=Hufsiella arboris TaxID=2695275 RepID=A0A7K1Y557_9SPHI|nr:DUF1080 domain-containing protein [Hufsiella arboris]MXV49724.1 DUF1080 domain-containing protein [Hufsiella arboris]